MIPDVDIIIVSYNTREVLLACLSSIAEHPPSTLGRVIVVDNASTDGSVDAVRSLWPAVHVLALESNVGFGRANNAAIRASSATLVLLLNSDTLVSAGTLDALVARLIRTGATAAGPLLVDDTGRFEISYGRMLSPATEFIQLIRRRAAGSDTRIATKYVARLVAEEREVDWISGACLLVRRAAALEAGLFDERFFLYEEDVDFCAALRARGGRMLFTPHAQIVHLGGRSVAATQAPAAAAPSGSAPAAGVGVGPRANQSLSRGAAASGGGAPRAASQRWLSSSAYDRSHVAFYEKHLPRWAPVLRWWKALRGRASP
jgi:N-acetylglucosaminyl-diphospho-decaprenol L-rhamnosyltransferase